MEAVTQRTIMRTLSQSETVTIARNLAELMNERERILIEKKAAMDDFKAQIEAKNENIHRLSSCIHSGQIEETVTCIVRKNYADGVKEYIHEGEVVATEPLSPDDMQVGFDE